MKNLFLTLFIFLLSPVAVMAQSVKITHGPYLQNLGERDVTIVWTTDKNAVSWVEVAPDDNTHFYLTERPKFFASKNGIKLESTVHAVKLKGLSPATKYRYRVFSQEITERNENHISYGNVASTSAYRPFSFVTLDINKPAVSFTMVNDIHGRSAVLEQLLSQTDPTNNDMVFFNGDMVSSLIDEDDLFNGFMDASVKSFAANVPMYYARGNHETRGIFATHFQDYFSPLNSELYYIVRQGPICFVVLDSGEDKPDSDIEYSGITVYDDYRTQEAEWLKDALKSDIYTSATFKVVICHMPPENEWHGESEVLKKFVPLLNSASVDVMLCGHVHQHIKRKADDKVHFPVLINSNNAVVKGTVTGKTLNLDVLDSNGKKTDQLIISH
ncbi:MAG: metallophosphoesterase [Tannerellaceae bacterium]|jgi:Icc-related predicted phosphoesterase|nr:metallophosphoesterase [Tannerellaceae bacterium]